MSGELILKVPNILMHRLYIDRLNEMLLPEPEERDTGKNAAKLVYQKGEIDELCQCVGNSFFKSNSLKSDKERIKNTLNIQHFNLSEYLKDKQSILEEYLKRIILQFDQQRELVQAMRHSLMAGGKRLRPVLAMASAEAVGGDFRLTLPAACAIEMIHTYSLIHDDLPAMDNDDLRRGVPTCHKAFSEATAILAGDALLTHAFKILSKPDQILLRSTQIKSESDDSSAQPVFELLPDRYTLLELVALLSDAAGVDGMVEGQMMDMMGDISNVPPLPSSINSASYQPESHYPESFLKMDHLQKLHRLKTGRMIIASVQAGAISVGVDADAEIMTLLTRYAERIGLAFQVTDDILNVEGDPSVMGKAAGSDRLNDKLTFPALLGVVQSKKFADQLIDDAIESLTMLPLDCRDRAMPLKEIAQYILKRKK